MKDSTIKDLDQLHTKAKTARGKLEGVWFLNLAYYQNMQWLAWNGAQLWSPPMPRSKVTVVDNRITPVVRTEVAKMTKNQPVFTVTPRSGEEEDANAAELGENLMRYLWPHIDMAEKARDALLWSRICGAGFLKPFWDPSIGDSVEVLVGDSGQVLSDENGSPIKTGTPSEGLARSMAEQQGRQVVVKKIAQGDIRVEVRSPFQMALDPIADSFSEVEWLVEETVKSVDYVRRRYGADVQADAPANPGLIESRMANSPSSLSSGSGQGGYQGVKIREYWCKPGVDHPQGRRVVWTKDKILKEDSAPFDPMPYVMLSGISTPGRLWPMSIVEHLRGPQTELNKVKSQIAENRNRIGNPTILASRQAIPDPEKFTEATVMPGGVHFYDDIGSPNALPRYLEAPQLPAYVVEEIQRIEESIQEISGQHEVTSAQVPPGVTAASAINLLQEADDTRLGPAIKDYERQLGKLGEKVLKLAARYYTDERTVQIGGEEGSWQIFPFRGAMLRENTQVEVQAGSAFPQSKAAKQAAMQDLLTFFVQSGNPPHGRQLAQFLQDWEVGGADRLIEDYTKDERQINRENSKLLQGIQLPINDYDNDQAHLDGHEDEQKSTRYEQAGQQAYQAMEQHVMLHRQRLADQQQAQMQLQMQMQGTPPPDQQGQQMQMDMSGQAQQQGMQQAQGEQQQRQAEEDHQQGQQGQEQDRLLKAAQSQAQHEQEMRHREERHHADLARVAAQTQAATQQRSQGGRRTA